MTVTGHRGYLNPAMNYLAFLCRLSDQSLCMKLKTPTLQKTCPSTTRQRSLIIPDNEARRRTPAEVLSEILKLSDELSANLNDRYARSRIGQAVQDIKDKLNGKI